ncbi:hypothetical protein Hanom_Chr16g01435091 [Helianthus anomalus]
MHLNNCIGDERVFNLGHLCVVFACLPLRVSTRSCFTFFVFLTAIASCFGRAVSSVICESPSAETKITTFG